MSGAGKFLQGAGDFAGSVFKTSGGAGAAAGGALGGLYGLMDRDTSILGGALGGAILGGVGGHIGGGINAPKAMRAARPGPAGAPSGVAAAARAAQAGGTINIGALKSEIAAAKSSMNIGASGVRVNTGTSRVGSTLGRTFRRRTGRSIRVSQEMAHGAKLSPRPGLVRAARRRVRR